MIEKEQDGGGDGDDGDDDDVYCFFFSSRRRHTRLVRDWSSDVCSSDLFEGRPVHRTIIPHGGDHRNHTSSQHISPHLSTAMLTDMSGRWYLSRPSFTRIAKVSPATIPGYRL